MSRTLPAGLNRLWPYAVAGVALAVALVAALAVARQYGLADEQRQGQLAMLETRGSVMRLMSDTARTPRELEVLVSAELSPPVELRDDRVVASELREARIRVGRLADKARGRPAPEADAEAVWQSLTAAAARAGRVAERTRHDANLNAAYSAAAGAFLVAVLLWMLLAGRRKAAVEAAETRALRWFRGLVQNSSDAILVTRPTGEIRYTTPSIERIVGHPAGELAGRSLVDLAPETDREALATALADVGATPRSDEWRVRHRDGTTVPVEAVLARWDDDNRRGDAVVVNLRDVRERKALEDQLRHRAFHDELTGLANRALFEDRLTHALARARRHAAWVAVLFLDLDDFKPVNDALGHPAGDALLQEVARRIAECLRASDTGARVGGDEFAVLLEDAASPAEADEVAERLLETIRQPVVLSGQELFPSASLGMALEEAGGATATELLRDADVAMYAAKRTGKGQISRFETAMRTNAVERLHLRADLERAVERGELALLYQPIVQLDTGAVIEVEALARWHHPLRGLLNPDQFIPLAEETGLIVSIGRHLLRRACAEAATWRAPGGGPSDVSVSVNLSARQLQHARLADDVRDALRDSGLPASRLVLEVTENVLIDDAARALEQLEELRGLGARIALDDFGTGYSSLSYVRRFPLDELKVDRSFIDRLGQADSDSALVHTIATLADNLGVRLVAEGIERKEQLTALQDLRCELGQGFLFARPLESEALVALLQEGSPAEPPVGAA